MKWVDLEQALPLWARTKYKMQFIPFFGWLFQDYCLAIIRRVKK